MPPSDQPKHDDDIYGDITEEDLAYMGDQLFQMLDEAERFHGVDGPQVFTEPNIDNIQGTDVPRSGSEGR